MVNTENKSVIDMLRGRYKLVLFTVVPIIIAGIAVIVYTVLSGASGDENDVSSGQNDMRSGDDEYAGAPVFTEEETLPSVNKTIDKAPLHGGQVYRSKSVVVPFKRSNRTDFPVIIRDEKDEEKNAPGEGN